MFYDKYIRLCNSANKSPSAVALEIGITKSTVSRWKAGSTPNYATAQKVADYFGVSAKSLLEGEKKLITQSDEPTDESYQIIKEFILNADQEQLDTTRKFIELIKTQRK